MNETPTQGKVLLIGGNLICGTMNKRGLLSGVEVVDALVGASPFSLACQTPRRAEQAESAVRRVDLENGLEAYLQQHSADWLVVDLHYVCQPLISCDGCHFTRFSDVSPAQLGKNAAAVNPRKLPAAEQQRLIEAYADTLLKFFPGERIALLKTYKSSYYVVKNRVREQEAKSFNQFVGNCEDWFQARTGCTAIDTLKFYYMEKKSGGMQYEKEAYSDLADNVKRFVRQKHVRRRPIFRYSMDRYCRYYHNIYKKAFGAFLRTGNAVENLVYSSEPWFVKENYELLRAAEKLLKSGYREVAEALDPQWKNAAVVGEILLAMDAVLQKNYIDPAVRYERLFENRITVRSLWQSVQKYAREKWPEILPERITEANYGYYFSLMQLELTDDKTVCGAAVRTIERLQQDETVELTPHVLDIWGSCVSRLNFQYAMVDRRCEMVFRGNMFQALPLFIDAPPVEYDAAIFAPPITADNKVVQFQLDSRIRETLDESRTAWLVVDLYTLTALSIRRYRGKVYCDNNGVMSKKLDTKKVTLHKEFSNEEIFAELDKFAAYARARYGDRVILIKHKRMEHYIDYQGVIHRFPEKDYNDSVERNPYNDLYTDYFARQSGCYYIDIIDQFLSDEMNLLYLNSVHYENEFYDEVRRLMRYILTEQPNQRHFTTYDSLTRIKRIARLRQNNPDNPVVRTLFGDGWLDDCLMRIDPAVISQNAAAFARLYDERYPSAKAAVEKGRLLDNEAAIAAIAAIIAADEAAAQPKKPPKKHRWWR